MSDVIKYPLSAAIELCEQLDKDTSETDDLARGNHVVPTEWAQQLERQRDFWREKYATEATEHMLEVNKLCNERDEAREEVRLLQAILDIIRKDSQ